MTHSFIDQYSHLDSPLHRLDPRGKIVAFFLAVVALASAPRGELQIFALYYAALAVMIAVSRVPIGFIALRCLAASPFILTAAALPYLSLLLESGGFGLNGPAPLQLLDDAQARELALSLLLKAYGAIILLTLLTSTSRFDHLLWALRQLKAPEVLHVIATLMYRYIFILLDEWRRMSRGRQMRTPHGIKQSRVSVYGKQVALVFLRGWERAERVQAAMAVRGFTGQLPVTGTRPFRIADALFAALLAGFFLLVRFLPALRP